MRRSKGGAPFSLFAFQDAITSVCGVVVLITLMLALELTRRVTGDETPVATDARSIQETQDEIFSLRNEIESLVKESESNAATFKAASAKLSKSEARSALQDAQKRLENAQKEQTRLQGERQNAQALQDEIATFQKQIESLAKEQNDADNAVKNAQSAAEQARKDTVQTSSSEFYVFPENGREAPWFVELSRNRLTVVGAKERQEFDDVESFVNWAKKRSRREEYFVLIARPSGVENFEKVFDKLQTMDFRIGVELVGENKQLLYLTQ